MKVIIQRVSEASVSIEGGTHGSIHTGFMILLGIATEDEESDIDYLVRKIVGLRVFNDSKGVMNLNLQEVGGEVLLISQFTLHALTKKGNRPSYILAAKPEIAIPLYEKFIIALENALQKRVKTGIFGADMRVSLVNDGPVTIILDSRNKA